MSQCTNQILRITLNNKKNNNKKILFFVIEIGNKLTNNSLNHYTFILFLNQPFIILEILDQDDVNFHVFFHFIKKTKSGFLFILINCLQIYKYYFGLRD